MQFRCASNVFSFPPLSEFVEVVLRVTDTIKVHENEVNYVTLMLYKRNAKFVRVCATPQCAVNIGL